MTLPPPLPPNARQPAPNQTPKNFGLIGFPLGHSLSPVIHSAALRAAGLAGAYRLYPVAPLPEGEADLLGLLAQLRAGELDGLNVTIPHKSVAARVEERTPEVQALGAANTLIRLPGGRLRAANTDAPAFLADLVAQAPELGGWPGAALVLGAGGSARAVVFRLALAGWQVWVAARRPEQAQAFVAGLQAVLPGAGLYPLALEKDAFRRALPSGLALIVNATPAGMAPWEDLSPWPPGAPFPAAAFVYDLIYNPAETILLRAARAAGLAGCNGLGMLVEQAALSFALWTGFDPPRAALYRALAGHTGG